jgi:Aminotransferase class I and II
MHVRRLLLPLRIQLSISSPIIASVFAGGEKQPRATSRSLARKMSLPLVARAGGDGGDDEDRASHVGPKESTIRKMTRLAIEYGAVNLSQGFPNEGPPWELKLALAHAVLSGHPIDKASSSTTTSSDYGNEGEDHQRENVEQLKQSIVEMIQAYDDRQQQQDSGGRSDQRQEQFDELNQYSPPMGRLDLRLAIAQYYQRFYQYSSISPDDITVTLGATEAFASALRTIGRPGDKCVIFEPFHGTHPCSNFELRSFWQHQLSLLYNMIRTLSQSMSNLLFATRLRHVTRLLDQPSTFKLGAEL